jgi:hypothetical protein
MAITFLLILLFAAMLPACGTWRAVMASKPQVGRAWLMSSAGFSYYRALDQPYNVAAVEFWFSVAIIHGLGWVFLLLASVLVPRAWQERPAGAQTMRWRERWHRWSLGNTAERAEFRQRLLDRSAYFWLAARARLKPAYVWAVLGLVACGWVWGLARTGRGWLDEATYVLTGLILNMIIKVWFGLEAGRSLAEDRKQGALELLLSTPLTVRDILRGHLLALRRQFQGPVALVLVVFLLFMILGAADTMQQEAADRSLWVMVWAAAMVTLVADLAALHWLGMWQGLTAKSPTRAAVTNLGCIVLLPWTVATLTMFTATLVWPSMDDRPVMKFFLGLWFLLSIATDLGFGGWARHRLLTDFRHAATSRYEATPGFWKRLLGAPHRS